MEICEPNAFQGRGGVDTPKQNIISIMPAPLCHLPTVYNSEAGKYSAIGRPGLIFVPNDCNTAEFSISMPEGAEICGY